MTLQQLSDNLNKAIQPGQPLQVNFKVIPDDNFFFLLIALQQQALVVYNAATQMNTGGTQLTLSGQLLIYNQSCADFTLVFTLDTDQELVTVLNATAPSLGINDLISNKLIDPKTDSVEYLPVIDFADAALYGIASEEQIATAISAVKPNTGWSVLGLSLFPLTNIGYTYSASIAQGSSAALPQFWVNGVFQLGQTIVDLTVKVPVSPADLPGQWLINLSLEKPLQNTFNDLSNLLFFNNLNNLVPNQLLTMQPAPGKKETGIFLSNLQALLNLNDRSIDFLNIDIDAVGTWKIGLDGFVKVVGELL